MFVKQWEGGETTKIINYQNNNLGNSRVTLFYITTCVKLFRVSACGLACDKVELFTIILWAHALFLSSSVNFICIHIYIETNLIKAINSSFILMNSKMAWLEWAESDSQQTKVNSAKHFKSLSFITGYARNDWLHNKQASIKYKCVRTRHLTSITVNMILQLQHIFKLGSNKCS